MLQWFNKRTNSISSSKDQQTNQQHSSSSVLVLTEEDYEFLFNQLLDGVAHGWHKERILQFFHNLEPRSNSSQWISWMKGLEQRVVYANDPSQRRVGAILLRLAEITKSNAELREFGRIARTIGRKLLASNVADLIWEYDGQDRVVPENDQPQLVEAENSGFAVNSANKIEQSAVSSSEEPFNSVTQPFLEISNTSATGIEQPLSNFTEQPTQSPDLVPDSDHVVDNETIVANSDRHDSIESIEIFTEQLTLLQDSQSFPATNSAEVNHTEQPTQSPDIAEATSQTTNNSVNHSPSIKSLEALTEQLTVLQDDDDSSEADTILENSDQKHSDLEPTLVALKNSKTEFSTSVSVASFLEATKALVQQEQKNRATSLSWEEFVAVLEQDPLLAQQVAQHLQISTTNPHEIVKAAVNFLVKQPETTELSPAKAELVKSWFDLGLKQASAEDFLGAIASWDKALKLNPHLSEAWHNKGSALGRLQKYEEAINSFNQAIKIAPEHYQAWNDRAHALYQVQKWQQAVESWDKAISIVSDNYQFWYNRGCALEQLQRYDDSILSYEKTLEIKPDFQPARARYISLVTERSSSASN